HRVAPRPHHDARRRRVARRQPVSRDASGLPRAAAACTARGLVTADLVSQIAFISEQPRKLAHRATPSVIAISRAPLFPQVTQGTSRMYDRNHHRTRPVTLSNLLVAALPVLLPACLDRNGG